MSLMKVVRSTWATAEIRYDDFYYVDEDEFLSLDAQEKELYLAGKIPGHTQSDVLTIIEEQESQIEY